MKRRDFFKSGTRAVILAGLGGAAAWLTLSGKVKENSVCPPSGDCRSCGKLSSCNKSQVTKTDGYGKR